jgi:tetraacyldisaccharide 4'-kinase
MTPLPRQTAAPFWLRHAYPLYLLTPLYAALARTRRTLYARGVFPSTRLAVPTISVGNLTWGGTGKTPLVGLIAAELTRCGAVPGIISRGYGRRSRGPVVVSDGRRVMVEPENGGDEPVLLARKLPGAIVVVAEHRSEAGRIAAALGATVVILDDGFQHLAVARDLDLLLLDDADPLAGGLPPGGALREPADAVGRANGVVVTRCGPTGVRPETLSLIRRYNAAAPVFSCRLAAGSLRDEQGNPVAGRDVASLRFLAVCGIARPESFRRTLSEADIFPEDFLSFPDHCRYGERERRRILAAARRVSGGAIITTEKDAVKLRGRLGLPLLDLELLPAILEPGFGDFLGESLRRETHGRP